MGIRTAAGLILVGVTTTVLVSGCGPDAICASDEYPVAAVRSSTGRACVAEGQEPPAGYVRFPAGQEPKHVDDEWDRYWSEHQLDESGREVTGP
jgi:hypothetical protein